MASKLTNRAMVSSAIAKKTCMVVNANVITGALVTGILSSGDIIRILKGEFSPILKNITKTTASIVGGIIGMLVFGSIGLYIPSVSTAIISLIGGIIGLVLGSILMTKIIIKMLNSFIQEDVINMLEIFRNVFIEQSKQYLLNEEELHQAIEDFNARPQMMKVELRDMYSKDHRERYAQNIIDLEIARIVKHRMYLHIPSDTEIYEVLEHI